MKTREELEQENKELKEYIQHLEDVLNDYLERDTLEYDMMDYDILNEIEIY